MSLHVLLVEPDAAFAEEIRRALDPVGVTVTSVLAGEPAVERCRHETPDLILLAAELPDMSGFSVCNRLKRAHASVPLILYTAEATQAALEAHRSTRTRADDYLRRPFELADLLARAASLLHVEPPPRPPPPREPDGPPMLRRSTDPALRAVIGAHPTPPDGTHAPGKVATTPHSTLLAAPGDPAPIALARLRVGPPRNPADVFEDQPRDPQPPKGTPEERLEYFRERLRARDTFLARVRDAVAALEAARNEAAGERDVLKADLAREQQRAADLERRLGEAAQDAAATAARLDDLRRQLQESETNRQAASEVLSETLQRTEATERDLSERLGLAEAERARLDAELAGETESHLRALSAIEAAQAEERSAFDAERAEMEAQRSRERADAAARLVRVEERTTALARERDEQASLVRRLQGEVVARDEREAAARLAAEAAQHALRDEVAEANARLDALTGELAEVAARAAALEKEAGSERERARRLEGDVGRLAKLEGAADVAARLEREVAGLRELVKQRTAAAQAADKAAQGSARNAQDARSAREGAMVALRDAQAARKAAEERLAAERARLEGELARMETELHSARARAEAAQADRNEATTALERSLADQDRLRALENAETAKRHASELARLKAALADSERKLEAGAREAQKHRARAAELEKARPAPEATETAELKARAKKLSGEVADLKEENEFLNGEVARFQQKARDLAAQIASLKES